jgi:hypothetical protein
LVIGGRVGLQFTADGKKAGSCGGVKGSESDEEERSLNKNSPELDRIFTQIIEPPLAVRLLRQLGDATRALLKQPGDFLRNSLLPGGSWFPRRFVGILTDAAGSLVAHPVRFVAGALTPDEIGRKRRRRFAPILVTSVAVHSVLIAALFVISMMTPFLGIHITEHPYSKLDIEALLKTLHYPPGMLKPPPSGQQMTLEEIRKRALDRQKREEEARLERERRRKEQEEAARKEEEARKAEAARKEQEAKAGQTKPSGAFGEINVTPIKDIVGELYQMYQSGQLDLGDNYSIMASFRIVPDGSIPKESIKIIHQSGSKVIDTKAVEVLWSLGESHALGPLSSLSSNTIELRVNETVTKLSITSFAPTPEEAKAKVTQLSFLLKVVGAQQKTKNPMVAELLSHLVMKADNKRIDADMTVPRARASEMMQTQFSKNSGGSQ